MTNSITQQVSATPAAFKLKFINNQLNPSFHVSGTHSDQSEATNEPTGDETYLRLDLCMTHTTYWLIAPAKNKKETQSTRKTSNIGKKSDHHWKSIFSLDL